MRNPLINLSATGTIIITGLVAGTLDILSAMLYYFIRTGKSGLTILNFVASGAFGKDAISGGAAMAVAGLFFHFFIAFCWTLLFFFIYPQIHSIIKNKIITGFIYGVIVWTVMNLIVMPMSAIPKRPFIFWNALISMLIIIMAIGLPISIIISKYYSNLNQNKRLSSLI